MLRTEGYFHGYDGKDLYFQTWQQEEAKLHLMITHGLAEHSGAYKYLAEGLMSDLPVNIYAWDLRGHGRSYGKRGVVKNFSEYTKDLFCFYHFLKDQINDLPVCLGHSMGGLILTYALSLYEEQIKTKALVLSSPLFGVKMEVSPFKEYAARLLSDFAPSIALNNEIDFKSLSHDKKIIQEYENDALRHNKISSRVYLGFIETFPKVMAAAAKLQMPVFLQYSGDDHLVSVSATEKFYDLLGSSEKEKIKYTSMYHEIYNEVDRELVYKDLIKYLRKYIA
tara:strand:+ start:13928 stop:14767 length:840 start_codon:yes stop_codon:yes gene_type:complete